MKPSVITLDNAPAGEIELDEQVFGLPVRKDILARMVNWQLAKRRAGTHKTEGISGRLGKLGWGSVLVIDGPVLDENFRRAAANLIGVDLLPQQGANVYDILRRDTLVLTRDAVQHLEARLK